MSKSIWSGLRRLVMVLLCIVLCASMVRATDLVEQVVAVVDNDPIMLSELQAQLQIAMISMKIDPGDSTRIGELKEQILNQTIDQRVLYQEAILQGYNVTDEEILQAVDDAIDRNKTELGSDALFQVQLQREGLTEDDLRLRYAEQARTEILTGRLIQSEVHSAVEVTSDDIQRFYDDHKSELPDRSPRYHLQHIMILISPDDAVLANAEQTATEVAGKITAGELTFVDAAARYSDDPNGKNGGNLGQVQRGDFSDRLGEGFENELFGLDPEILSKPIRSPLGYHLVMLGDKAPDGSSIEMAHILFGTPISEADVAGAEAEIADIRRQILSGASFAEMAKTLSHDVATASTGGDLGWLPEETLAKPILDALGTMAIGDISEPVRGGDAYHIFNYVAHEIGGDYTFDEIKEELRSLVENEKLERRYRTWLDESKSRHYIENRGW